MILSLFGWWHRSRRIGIEWNRFLGEAHRLDRCYKGTLAEAQKMGLITPGATRAFLERHTKRLIVLQGVGFV